MNRECDIRPLAQGEYCRIAGLPGFGNSQETDCAIISVIIPVFNVRSYLKCCLDSISNNTFRNIEIILIDDGSTDGSGEICDACAAFDSRIRVFHKNNGGQSDARNVGLDAMRGFYVAFVDADDCVAASYLEALFKAIKLEKSQIAICGSANFRKEEEIENNQHMQHSAYGIAGRNAAMLSMGGGLR